MGTNEDVSTGEIYRRLCDMDERYEKKLDRIEDQVRVTNGRTTRLELRQDHVDSEIKRIKRHVEAPQTPAALPAAPESEYIGVKISPKVWAAIYTAGGAMLMALLEWARTRIAQP